MEQVFAAFIIVSIMLEMYELNFMRKAVVHENRMSVFVTIVSTALIYALFIAAGWWASSLVPEVLAFTKLILSVALVGLVVLYGFKRNRHYANVGSLVFANFNLFLLIAIGQGILQLSVGLVLGIQEVNFQWFAKSFALGFFLFGVAVFYGSKVVSRIFGVKLRVIKMVSYIIAALLLVYGHIW